MGIQEATLYCERRCLQYQVASRPDEINCNVHER